jgi:hypothetical protein
VKAVEQNKTILNVDLRGNDGYEKDIQFKHRLVFSLFKNLKNALIEGIPISAEWLSPQLLGISMDESNNGGTAVDIMGENMWKGKVGRNNLLAVVSGLSEKLEVAYEQVCLCFKDEFKRMGLSQMMNQRLSGKPKNYQTRASISMPPRSAVIQASEKRRGSPSQMSKSR